MDLKKRNILIVCGVIVILALAIVLGFFVFRDNEKSDAVKFKEEYESLNNTVRESDGGTYKSIKIQEDNPIVYVDALEATRLIKEETGILYIGANWCPWCRNIAPVLIDVAKSNGLKKVYYLDLTTYRNVWDVVNGELVKTQKEKEGYYDLLDVLDPILGDSNYAIIDGENTFETDEKRIYMPTVLAFKKGEITDSHVGSVNLNDDQTKYDLLTDDQREELVKRYEAILRSNKSGNICGEDSSLCN